MDASLHGYWMVEDNRVPIFWFSFKCLFIGRVQVQCHKLFGDKELGKLKKYLHVLAVLKYQGDYLRQPANTL